MGDQDDQNPGRERREAGRSAGWRSILLVAAVALVGALGTLAVGAAEGMRGGELYHLAALLVPALLATVVAMAIAGPLLARSSLRQRFVAVAVIAALVGLVNLAVLARLMFVSGHDATQLAILLVYSIGAGVGAAVALARSSSTAFGRLAATARALGDGDLHARTGRLDAGPELDDLALALDRMADRLERSLARERQVEARRRDLITAVSHDLRTPLAGLRAMVEAIDDGVVDDLPTVRRYVVEMRRATDSLVLLVDDLFELAQLDAGALQAETERARLEDIVSSAVAVCRGQAEEKGVALRANVGNAGDAHCSPRLVRVVQNLLQNAIRHTPTDGTVWIEARRKAGRLELAVEDTGEGIDPGSLERVFDPFWRADAARSGDGTGLGLALAKRIVEALGGEIHAESELAHGSRFSVLVPAGPVPPSAPAGTDG